MAEPGLRAGEWPQWRGPFRNGHTESEEAPASLPTEIHPTWKLSIGPGFSAPIVDGDDLVYLDAQKEQETVHLIEASTGHERWSEAFAEAFTDEWGMGPRSTPLFDGDRIYVQSCKGEFRCLQRKDGKTLWRTHFEKDFGVQFVGTKVNEGAAIRRGHNGSAIIDGDHIIVPVGSTNGATLVCFDKRKGTVLWKSLSDETAYSSPVLTRFEGVPQLVAFTADALVGVAPANGQVLWRVPISTNAKRHALSPVLLSSNRVVVASHSYGMLCLQIQQDSGGWKASPAWLNKDLKINLSTPTEVDGFLYGFGAGQDFVCVDGASGKIVWSQTGFGKGQKTDYAATLAIQHSLLVLNETGQLFLMAADPVQYRSLGQTQVCGKTWVHPAYAHGKLYVRDGRSLQCFSLVPGSDHKP